MNPREISLFDSDTKSVNESAIENLKVGKHAYVITNAKPHEKDGKISIIVGFKHLSTGTRHSAFFNISAEGDAGRIAKQGMKALWDSVKLSGAPGLDRLPNFVDKVVEIDAYENKQGENTYVNIRSIHPYSGEAPPKQEYNQPEDPDDKIDMTEKSAAPAAEQSAIATPAASPPVTKKWAGRKK